jgi:hypothetical protein
VKTGPDFEMRMQYHTHLRVSSVPGKTKRFAVSGLSGGKGLAYQKERAELERDCAKNAMFGKSRLTFPGKFDLVMSLFSCTLSLPKNSTFMIQAAIKKEKVET